MSQLILGRERELEAAERFVAGVASGPCALVLAGEAGAGKTTLFEAVVSRAREAGATVLETRPAEGESQLSFAGLGDLLERVLGEELEALPPPQRRALAVALVLEEAAATPPQPHAIAAAVRSVLRSLARRGPLLIAVDDVQWLDAPTAEAVGFAFRRLEHEPVGLLCAQRTSAAGGGIPLGLERVRLRLERLEVGGLSVGALHRLLRLRLGLAISHPTLRRISDASGGNPFTALEIGRALQRRGGVRFDSETLPVPETVEELVQERLRELPEQTIRTLRLASLTAERSLARLVAAGAEVRTLDPAFGAGFLVAEGGGFRFGHPLFASAVVASTPPGERRQLHATLAASARDLEERARHLALASERPTAENAAELDAAARAAAARGAAATAAELLELAASLTPAGEEDARRRRELAAADALALAGEMQAARALLERLLGELPAGVERSDVLARLAWIREDDFAASSALLEQALVEAGEDPRRRAEIQLALSDTTAVQGQMARARDEARAALAEAERAGDPSLLAFALAQTVVMDALSGAPVDVAALERGLALEPRMRGVRFHMSPSYAAGTWLQLEGRLDEARAAFERALARAEAEGIEYWRGDVSLRLSLLECEAGNLGRAHEIAQQGLDVAEQSGLEQLTSALLYAVALSRLLLGDLDGAREQAAQGLELSLRVGDRAYGAAHESLLAIGELLRGNAAAAVRQLEPLLAWLERETNARAALRSLPTAIEALLAAGEAGRAREALRLLETAPGITRVAAPLVERCRGLVLAAEGDLDGAARALEAALRLYDDLPLPLERGRTLIALGGVRRRLKQRAAARQALVEAREIFERLCCPLWAERARSELARVSGRQPGSAELSESERRVAELVAAGMSNREVAATLFVSVRAVESTLSKVYGKLGVRSRTALAARLHDRG